MRICYAIYDSAFTTDEGHFWTWFDCSLSLGVLRSFFDVASKHRPDKMSELTADDFWGGVVRLEKEWTVVYKVFNGGYDSNGRPGRYVLLTAWTPTKETEGIDMLSVFKCPVFKTVAATVDQLPVPKPKMFLSDTFHPRTALPFDQLLQEIGSQVYFGEMAERAIRSFGTLPPGGPALIKYERTKIAGHEFRAEVTITGESHEQRMLREKEEMKGRIHDLELSVKDRDKQIHSLTKTNERLTKEKDEIQIALNNKQKEVDVIKQEIESIRGEMSRTEKQETKPTANTSENQQKERKPLEINTDEITDILGQLRKIYENRRKELLEDKPPKGKDKKNKWNQENISLTERESSTLNKVESIGIFKEEYTAKNGHISRPKKSAAREYFCEEVLDPIQKYVEFFESKLPQ